jgi:MFS family permease
MTPQIREVESENDLEHDNFSSQDDQQTATEAGQDSHEPSYTISTAALCVCMLTHSYLLISVFPYSGFMAIELIPSANEDNAGSYAGFIASAFMIGRATSSLGWGKVADTYGRTAVLYASLGFSCIFSVLFGIAPSFAAALAFRFCLGLVNGILGTVKTVISELAEGDERLEARGMSIVVGMWGWGFLVSPAISGALAEPIRQYPDAAWLQDGLVGDILRRHPFLLPNLLGAVLCLIAMATVALFVRETLPAEKRRNMGNDVVSAGHQCYRRLPGYRYEGLPVLKAHQSDVDLHEGNIDEEKSAETLVMESKVVTMASLWARKKTRTCLSIYWAYSFVGLTIDEAFPLFVISRIAGFGISEREIGKILSLCGLIFAVAQYWVYVAFYSRFGLYGSIRVGSSLAAPLMFLVPISLLLNQGAETGELRWSTFYFLAAILAAYRVFALVFFTSISVAVNRSVPSSERATMNGLSVLGGSVAKGLGPIFAGCLVTFSVSWLGRFGSILIFAAIGLLGCGVMASAFLFLHDDEVAPADESGSNSRGDVQKIELIERHTDAQGVNTIAS